VRPIGEVEFHAAERRHLRGLARADGDVAAWLAQQGIDREAFDRYLRHATENGVRRLERGSSEE
jgi:hypothetical protein